MKLPPPSPAPQPNDGSEKIVGRITGGASARTETERYVIHHKPRISASMLARYIVSDPLAQQTILRNSKCAAKFLMNRYKLARPTIHAAFKDGAFDKEMLADKAQMLKSEKGDSQDAKDSRLCGKLLENLARIEFPPVQEMKKLSRPQNGWEGIKLAGVDVAFEPNIVFSFSHRKSTKIGALLIHSNKQVPLDKELHGNPAGDYIAVLLHRMLEEKLQHIGAPSPKHCLAVDTHLLQTFHAPTKYRTLFKQLEAACTTIAALWDGVPIK